MNKEYNLEKFVKAHEKSYETALSEIKSGQKKGHWMWYIFPQIKGLGISQTSQYYAIEDVEQAKAFLNHPVLGKNIREISNQLLKLTTNNAAQVFFTPDDMKLRSSMTLFSCASDEHIFEDVLKKFYNGEKDNKTIKILQQNKSI